MEKLPADIQSLVDKYLSGTATPEEISRLNDWYHSFDDTEAEVETNEPYIQQELSQKIKKRIEATIGQRSSVVSKRKWYVAAAAISILILMSGYYFLYSSDSSVKIETAKIIAPKPVKNNVIVPGGDKALLTLSDGSTIILDRASNGLLTTQGNIQIEKLENGLLSYTINGKIVTENDEAFYNTITTPRGGQYQVTLSDGTKVWLNAASSIRFPVVFTGKERRVIVTGETYFEVAHNDAMPFKIKVVSSEVEVMGTHFNINAYDDEASVKTTLLEGRVKVYVPSEDGFVQAKFLAPGQQSSISKNGTINILDKADTEEVMAWKNGRFQYKSADLKSILRQVARWYDVDIEYRGTVSSAFTGQLPRSVTVSKVLEKLELTGEVNFKIEGRKIIVSK